MDQLAIEVRRHDTGEIIVLEMSVEGLGKALEGAYEHDANGTVRFLVNVLRRARIEIVSVRM